LTKAIVILAGGVAQRFGQNKCLIELAGKPLVLHVIDCVSTVADEKVVVAGSNAPKKALYKLFESKTKVVTDIYSEQSPLVGALTGLENVNAEYSLLLPCDTPFVSAEIVALLFDLCVNKSAAIPRWPNGYIEPLQAVYHTCSAIDAAKKALNEGKRDFSSMISYLRGVRYVSTLVLQQLDPKLSSFFNINTSEDLKKAESFLKKDR